jgi:hypothetical protein
MVRRQLEVVRFEIATLLNEGSGVTRMVVFRTEAGRRKIIICCRMIRVRHTGATIELYVMQIVETKGLWQPYL